LGRKKLDLHSKSTRHTQSRSFVSNVLRVRRTPSAHL